MSPLALVAAIVLALFIFQWLQKRGRPASGSLALPAPSPARDSEQRCRWTRTRAISVWTEGGNIQGTETWSIDFREMTLVVKSDAHAPTAFLLRRASPTVWETKLDPKWREDQLAAIRQRVAMLQQERAGGEAREGEARHTELEEFGRETDLAFAEEELENLRQEPGWLASVVPEEFVASIETAYQRYIAEPMS